MDPQTADYTFLTAIARGWGLAIRCHACDQERRWTDKDLEERFGSRVETRVANLRAALVCGCGGRSVTLSFYQAGGRDTSAATGVDVEEKERKLRGARA